MKELSIEEKAKRYDETLAKAIKIHRNYKGRVRAVDVVIEEVFPELKESEDERIRKVLLNDFKNNCSEYYCEGVNRDMIIAWLEKQGEDEYIDPDTLIQQRVDALNDIIADQKLTDKVEPKFKEGDWVVYENRVGIIVRILKEHYIISFDEVEEQVSFTFNDRITKWTIQDAKDGDVLVTDNGLAFIYNGYLEKQQWPFAYGGINIYGRFNICDGLLPFTHQKVVPATKEQCNALIKAMTNAGYECDVEKKELKKIESTNIPENFEKYVEHLLSLSDGEGHSSPAKVKEVSAELFKLAKLEQNPVWSEEDETMWTEISDLLWEGYKQSGSKFSWDDIRNWVNPKLKSIKDRTLPQPKQEWSEEDEKMIRALLSICDIYSTKTSFYPKENKDIERLKNWLKSLKERYTWKPSDEQIEILEMVLTNESMDDNIARILRELREQLKKLKG